MTTQQTLRDTSRGRGRSDCQAAGHIASLWQPGRLEIAGQILRLREAGFTNRDIIDAGKAGAVADLLAGARR